MGQEKILNQFKTVHILTNKIVGQQANMEPIYEKNVIKISAHEWPLWVKNCVLHGFKRAEVVEVLNKDGQSVNDNQLVSELQSEIDAVLKPVIIVKADSAEQIEALLAANEELLKRLEALENKGDKDERKELIEMATELGLQFAKNIKTDALKALIENSK